MAEDTEPKTPNLTVENIMATATHCVSTEMSVREAILLLVTNAVSGAPIVDSQKKVMSVISQGDLLKLAMSVGMNKSISQCMTRLTKTDSLITLKKSDSFADAYKKFLAHSVHRLIVVDETGRLLGIVSRSSILKVLATPEK